jgi:uncharacterized protein (TIGR02231 family)
MIRSLTTVAFVCCSPAAFAADVSAPSRIDAVTVFPDQAQVTRSLKVGLSAGDQKLVIADLPAGIDPESVRVTATSDATVEIGSVDLRDVNPTPVEPKLTTEAEQHVQGLLAERAALDDRIHTAETKRKLIERLGAASTDGFVKGIGWGKTSAQQLKEAWGAFGDGLDDTATVIREAKTRQAAIDDEVQRIRESIEHDPQVIRPHGEARVALSASAETQASFNISYRMQRAGWSPVYDARLKSGQGAEKPSVDLVTRALVRQDTGEDWKDVDMTLSTARPSKGTSAPDLKPLTVALWQPVYAEPYRRALPTTAAPAGRPKDSADKSALATEQAPAPAPPVSKPAEERQAQVENTGTTVVYHIPGRVAVDSGQGARSLKVGDSILDAQLAVRAVPKQAATAYLTAQFRPKGDASLLPGKVSIYRDGQFVGSGVLPFIASGDDVKLGFGEDDRVKVERNAVKQTEGDVGVFASSHVEVQDFRIRVKNLHDRPVPVTVEDQIPVSESTEITVEKLSSMTPPSKTNVDDRRGVMAWTFDLKPGEEKEIRVAWRLKYPADRAIGWQNVDK